MFEGLGIRMRRRVALIVGCLAVVVLLVVPAGASALKWGQWVEAEDVTETSATIALYIHPLWPKTHWEVAVGATKCKTEPERCDDNFLTAEEAEKEGTIIQKSPYEIVEIDIPIPGSLFVEPLHPAKLYLLAAATRGEGEAQTGAPLPGGGADTNYESFETPGTPGPEEQAHIAVIEKERGKRAKKVAQSQKGRAGAEKKLAKDEKAHA